MIRPAGLTRGDSAPLRVLLEVTMRSLAAALLLLVGLSSAGFAQEFTWEHDLARAEARALAERKPLLLVFRCLP